MLKHLFSFLFLVSFLTSALLLAQDGAAAPAADTTVAAPAAAVSVSGGAGAEESAVDLSTMSYDGLIAYLSSLSAEEFGDVVVKAVQSGDRYLARRVLSAANQVVTKAEAEKAAALVAAVEARGEGVVVVRNNVIGTALMPMPNSLNQKFAPTTKIETSVEVPPATPTYSAGAAM